MQKSYTDLSVWLSGRQLVKRTYELTRLFPKEELFNLTNQMRRAAISVPSSLAEGCGRQHSPDTIRFLFIARGSLYELETQFYLASDLGYLDNVALHEILALLEECKKLVQGFIRYYRTLSNQSQVAEDVADYFPDNRQLSTDNQP